MPNTPHGLGYPALSDAVSAYPAVEQANYTILDPGARAVWYVGGDVHITQNAYWDTAQARWEYWGVAVAVRQTFKANGDIEYYDAPSGAAGGDPITWTLRATLKKDGSLFTLQDATLYRAAAGVFASNVGLTRFLYKNPIVLVKRTTTLDITAITETSIDWDSESIDTDGMHDNATNPNRLTATVAGKYLAVLNVRGACIGGVGTGFYPLSIKDNGGNIIALDDLNPYQAGGFQKYGKRSLSGEVSLAAGGWIEATAAKGDTSYLSMQIQIESSFGMHYIGE
jgi:hypothetical protein